jgi:uncharacterized protein (DUF1330 family)
MTAFVVVTVTPKDPEKLKEYSGLAGPTIVSNGGEPVVRGKVAGLLTGESFDGKVVVVFKFPSIDAIDQWYNSDEYQALIPLREEAADMTFVKLEG